MSGLTGPPEWRGTSDDPADEQFGDVVEPLAEPRTEADDYAAVLVGEPFDRAVIGRRGAAQGPLAIREALAGVKTHQFDAGPVGAVADAGDVMVGVDATDELPETVRGLQEQVRIVAGYFHETDSFPVFLGGDNSLTFPNAAPLLDEGSVGCVNFDAHLDVREVREDATSGTPYRQLHEAGLDAYACVGARHFETSTAYHEFVRERDGAVVTAEEVGEDPVAAVDTALDAMGEVDRIYLSLDVDVLDATAAPGVSAPTPGGLTTRECFRALRLAASDQRVAGFEVVECAPPLDDDDGRTVAAAARAVAHVLSARATLDHP